MNIFKKFILEEIKKTINEIGKLELEAILEDFDNIDIREIIMKIIERKLKIANDDKILQLYQDYCIDC